MLLVLNVGANVIGFQIVNVTNYATKCFNFVVSISTTLSILSKFLSKNEVLHNNIFRRYLMFRLFLIGALNMQITILAYWLYDFSKNVKYVGELGLWEAIPAIGFSFISGHFVDKKEKRNVLALCTLLYLFLAAYYVVLSYLQGATFGVRLTANLIFLGIFLGGVLRSFIGPATFSILSLLVNREYLKMATSWSSTAWYIGAVLGPLVGGLCIGVFGVSQSLIITIVVLGLAFLSILMIPQQAILNQSKEPMLKSLKQGLSFVFQTPIILSVLSLDMFAVLFGGAVALLPVFAKDILKVGEMGFGMLRAAPGLGAILMMLALSFVPIEKRAGMKLLLCIAAFGVCMLLFGLSTHFYWSLILLFLSGMFDAVSVVIRGTILQLHTPDAMRGRVAAVNTMFVSSSNELGEVESGYTAAWMGTVPAVIFGASMTLSIVCITALMVPKLRRLQLHNQK